MGAGPLQRGLLRSLLRVARARMGLGTFVLVAALPLAIAGCEKARTRDTYYPPAAEIYAGESGRLVMPDDELLPVLLGRTVEDYDHGWMAYVNGWRDLFANLKTSGHVRWIPPKTPILVVMTENRLGQVYIFVRFHPDRKPVGKLLEDPRGWWTTARNFQIVTGTDGRPIMP